MEIYRIVIADDHVIFRQGMKHLMEKDPGIKLLGEAGNSSELLEILGKLDIDLVVLDISMPGIGGIVTLQTIRNEFPQVKVLILTMHKQSEYMFQAISNGADGYLLKEDSDDEFFSAISAIRKGGIYITKHLQQIKIPPGNGLKQRKQIVQEKHLTQRETEVLKMVSEGMQSRGIADLLNISIRTVDNHRANIKRKMGFKTQADWVRYALKMGISELPA